jgi:bifunctional UDP-N-acetylglucosamine pyrophosphorylase / glucosamine-1-phosphate N-acetyltransferase
MQEPPYILILAASTGNQSGAISPSQPLLFRPILEYVLESAQAMPNRGIWVLHGPAEYGVDPICETAGVRVLRRDSFEAAGDLLMSAELIFREMTGPVLVLSGNHACVTPRSLAEMLNFHRQESAACTVAGTASEEECAVQIFEGADLAAAALRVGQRNGHGGHSLAEITRSVGGPVSRFRFSDALEGRPVLNARALQEAESGLRDRINNEFLERGVFLQDPRTTWIDPRCRIGAGTRIEGGSTLVRSVIGEDVVIESQCRLVDSTVDRGSRIKQGSYIENSSVGPRCAVGPYAHLRPESRLEADVKVGNFVELKKSTLGRGSKVSHLSYVGDAEVGQNVNFGCGFITCNFDGGPKKHRTVVEDDVFIGSDCQTVAPVRLGRGSYVAAGTTVTQDVPPNALAISRGRQVVKEEYAKKYRAPTGTTETPAPPTQAQLT